jgi:hypothetical protein
MRFTTTIVSGTGNTTGIEVPEEVVASLGPGRRYPVSVSLRGYTYRSTVAPMGGVYMISLSAENRTAAGVEGGDEVEVDVELDTAPRVIEVPEPLAEALVADPAAKAFFESLSYSKQQRYTLPVKDAKTDETRERRVTKAMDALREQRLL